MLFNGPLQMPPLMHKGICLPMPVVMIGTREVNFMLRVHLTKSLFTILQKKKSNPRARNANMQKKLMSIVCTVLSECLLRYWLGDVVCQDYKLVLVELGTSYTA